MLIRREGEAVLAIGQASHAWLSGQLARAWGNERFGPVEPREEVCLAAEQHDIGMALWDTAPTLDPQTGLPHSFMEMPLRVHMGLWARASRRMLAQCRYAALLVSLHGTKLYARRDLDELPPDEAEAVRGFLASQRELQDELIEALRRDPITAHSASDELIARNRQLIWTWDFLSLAVCLDWPPCSIAKVPARDGPVELTLTPAGGDRRVTFDPWPFAAAALEVRCEGRRLEGRFEDTATMRAALDEADWATLTFELVAPAT